MAKVSQYVIFGDQSWPVESLARALPEKSDISIWIEGRGWIQKSNQKTNGDVRQSIKERSVDNLASAIQDFSWDENREEQPTAIVAFQNFDVSQDTVEKLRCRNTKFRILHVGCKETRAALSRHKRSVAWTDLISIGVDTEIQLLEMQEKVRKLQLYFKDAERMALVLQDDPDPDGLAAAIAFRKILSRKAQTAPILSFGKISRPENVAMAKLLEIDIEQIFSEEDLLRFDKVVLIDCQPSFFKNRTFKVDAILDHHPRYLTEEQERTIGCIEIHESLGALSTLLTQMLRAADFEMSQRVATALLYGIKSDTLLLNRQVSDIDLEAFVYLYPRINANTLRRIERPDLPLKYLEALRGGLEHLKVSKKGIVVLALHKVEREEWIPQAADFALQVEGAMWAIGAGIFEDKVILSIRNPGYCQHCGEVIRELFNEIGAAGGHRTMAKAIVPLANWVERFGEESLESAALAPLVRKLLGKQIDKRSMAVESN